MRGFRCLLVLLLWSGALPSWAHLGASASLVIEERSPGRFELAFKLPIVEGRVLKARPVLPEVCALRGEPEVRSTGSAVLRSWSMDCAARDLIGKPIGVAGLLGTAQDVQLTITFFDGQKHLAVLRPTQSFWIVPPSPSLPELTWRAGREGFRRVSRSPELVLLLGIAALSGLPRRALLLGILAYALAHGAGHLLAERGGMAVTPALPRALTAGAAWLLAAAALHRGRDPTSRLGRHGWLAMALIGVLAGGVLPATTLPSGLSRAGQQLGLALFSLGIAVGAATIALAALQLRAAIRSSAALAAGRSLHVLVFFGGAIALGWGIYQASGMALMGTASPATPAVSLVLCAALALWCRQQAATEGQRIALILLGGGALVAGAAAVQRSGFSLDAVWALGSLALLGALLAWGRPWPRWAAISLLIAVGYVHGIHAVGVLLEGGSSRPADALGMLLLLALVPFACFGAISSPRESSAVTSARAVGVAALGLALLQRLLDYRDWVAGPVAAEAVMGLIRLPLLAAVVFLLALTTVPRRPREPGDPRRGLPWRRWVLLLGLAFFLIPHGTVVLENPFHTPRPPSAAAAQRILSTVLSEIYQAFNLPNEDEAFDALARAISEEFVADVYLDSRRRLTAGTREGAEVTVTDVGVISVGDVIPGGVDEQSFSYPCQWFVTARVRHWQHTHDRRNTYAGELTIRVEDNRWKITRVGLASEEREILSWKSS